MTQTPSKSSFQLPFIFSTKLIVTLRKYAVRSDPNFRFVQPLTKTLIAATEKRFSEPSFPRSVTLQVLEKLDTIEKGNFDTRVGITDKKLSEILIKSLDEDALEEFIERVRPLESFISQNFISKRSFYFSDTYFQAFRPEPWSVHRLVPLFINLPTKIKIALIIKAAQYKAEGEFNKKGYFNTLSDFLESLIAVIIKRKNVKVEIKPENEEVLQEVAKQMGFKWKIEKEFR